MVNILIGCTGSVATIKVPLLVQELYSNIKPVINSKDSVQIKIIATEHSKHFFKETEIPAYVKVYSDKEEWDNWKDRGDPIMHIDLGKWADILLIAPLDANTLAKISTGICDNLLTSTIRAWEMSKPLVFCPAMNTKMYDHPLTKQQIKILMSWGYHHIPVISKTLVCGDAGLGAMAEVTTIVHYINTLL